MRKTLTTLILAASLPTLALATPQDGPAPCHKSMHGEHRGGGPLKDLDLSAEQREQLGKLMRERKDDPREITQKYLAKLPQAEQDALKQELETARLEHDKAIRGILTAEQQKTFDSHKAEMDKRRAERAEFEAWKAEKDQQAQ